ncbi:MAG TPA: DUF6152 family protein [Caulobacteraceae bacterium]|jgi:hypothetical protein|nr:DUF6152 family protein [Caulobacteraceae bacterium]
MKRLLPLITLTAALLASGQASAHHSGAMYDDKKTLVFESATVKEFQWSNPHAWLEISVPTAKGPENWSLEMVGLGGMRRAGWKFNSVKPGDKVKVTVNPMRDGSHGGRADLVTLADGTVLRGQGPVRPGAGPPE